METAAEDLFASRMRHYTENTFIPIHTSLEKHVDILLHWSHFIHTRSNCTWKSSKEDQATCTLGKPPQLQEIFGFCQLWKRRVKNLITHKITARKLCDIWLHRPRSKLYVFVNKNNNLHVWSMRKKLCTLCAGRSRVSPVQRLAQYSNKAEPRWALRRYWLTRGMS